MKYLNNNYEIEDYFYKNFYKKASQDTAAWENLQEKISNIPVNKNVSALAKQSAEQAQVLKSSLSKADEGGLMELGSEFISDSISFIIKYTGIDVGLQSTWESIKSTVMGFIEYIKEVIERYTPIKMGNQYIFPDEALIKEASTYSFFSDLGKLFTKYGGKRLLTAIPYLGYVFQAFFAFRSLYAIYAAYKAALPYIEELGIPWMDTLQPTATTLNNKFEEYKDDPVKLEKLLTICETARIFITEGFFLAAVTLDTIKDLVFDFIIQPGSALSGFFLVVVLGAAIAINMAIALAIYVALAEAGDAYAAGVVGVREKIIQRTKEILEPPAPEAPEASAGGTETRNYDPSNPDDIEAYFRDNAPKPLPSSDSNDLLLQDITEDSIANYFGVR